MLQARRLAGMIIIMVVICLSKHVYIINHSTWHWSELKDTSWTEKCKHDTHNWITTAVKRRRPSDKSTTNSKLASYQPSALSHLSTLECYKRLLIIFCLYYSFYVCDQYSCTFTHHLFYSYSKVVLSVLLSSSWLYQTI